LFLAVGMSLGGRKGFTAAEIRDAVADFDRSG
jgi:hypothetical protein